MPNKADRPTAGAVILEHRERSKLSQDEVALALGVTEGAVSQWETGRAHPRRANALRLDALLKADGAITEALGYAAPSSSAPSIVTELQLVRTGNTAEHEALTAVMERATRSVTDSLDSLRRRLGEVEKKVDALLERSPPLAPRADRRRR